MAEPRVEHRVVLDEALLERHQAVREFVEHSHPGYVVSEIAEHARTNYRAKYPQRGWKRSVDHVLVHADNEFTVEATNLEAARSIQCKIMLLDGGELREMEVSRDIIWGTGYE